MAKDILPDLGFADDVEIVIALIGEEVFAEFDGHYADLP